MKELDPIQARMDILPFVVRNYFETIAEVTHDAQQRAENDHITAGLSKVIDSDPALSEARREFVIFRNDTLKAREGERQ